MRRLAYEAADCGLLSPDLAAGIRRVKGLKKIGVRLGNWLTGEQAQALWQAPDGTRVKGKRDRALLACGLRRREIVELTFDHLQQREEQRGHPHPRGVIGPDRSKGQRGCGSSRCIANQVRPAAVSNRTPPWSLDMFWNYLGQVEFPVSTVAPEPQRA